MRERGAVPAVNRVERSNFGSELHANRKGAAARHETLDKIGVKFSERPLVTMQDRDLRPRARGDMRKLERDEPAADEHERRRQCGQLEKLIARAQVLATRDRQI